MKILFSYFIQHYKLSFVILIAGLLLGVSGLMNLRREARPPVDFARVIVTTVHPGASSEEIEELITNKLEQRLQNINGIRKSNSISSPGLSQIILYLDLDNIDTEKVVAEIHWAIQSTNDLPADLLETTTVTHVKAAEIPIMSIAVIGPDQKRSRIAYELKTLLQNLPDIANIQLSGFQKREFQILLNPKKAIEQSISLSEVVKAVQAHSQDISAGTIRSQKTQNFVRVFGKIKKAKELENIVVRSNFYGKQILIKDIAVVKDAEEDQTSSFLVKDQAAVLLMISKKEKADMLKAIQQIEVFINDYKKTMDQELNIVTLFDESEKTKKRLNIVTSNALFGLVLVLLILLLCLPGWLGIATAFSLPFSILATIALIASMGVTFNVITTCAFVICIGMLVDNSIVISENYAQLRSRNIVPHQAALQSVMELWRPVVATTVTTVLAFLPMLLTKGIMGQFIRWMPIVVSIALMISLAEAFFLLPCRLRFTVSAKKKRKDSIWFLKIKELFERFMLKALERKYLSVFVVISIVIASSAVSYFQNRFILFPKENVEMYNALFELKKDLSLKEMEKRAIQLEKQKRQLLGEDNIQRSHISINSLTGVGSLTTEVHEQVAKKWDHKDILKKLRTLDSSPFTKLRFDAFRLGPPVGRPVELILFSQNELQLNQAVEEILKELTSMEGLLNIEDGRDYSGPEYAVYPDASALSRLRLDTKSVGLALKASLQGSIIGEITEKGESFYIRAKYSNEGRSSMDLLKYINILTPDGRQIPMNNVVKWKKTERGSEIKKHYSFTPSVTLYADVDLNKTTSIVANSAIQKQMVKIQKKYPAVSYKQAGEHESTKESISSLIQAMILVVFGIFSVLLLMFNSFSISLLILSNVFLGLVGISWAFLLHSKPLSFSTMVGTVGLAGVVINAAIILVSFIEKRRKETTEKNLNKILAKAAADRMRPIFITSATTVLGLFPTSYGIGGHDSFLLPVTLALTWGLISGTLLTLVWTPCGYAIILEISNWLKKKINRR